MCHCHCTIHDMQFCVAASQQTDMIQSIFNKKNNVQIRIRVHL